jgi:ribosomal protein S18 acetylase RimI-like enzyme
MYDLAAAAPGTSLHLADLPWRLSSPSARVPERTCLWEASDGTLLAWAVLQFPWHCLDYEIHPDARRERLEASVPGWAAERLGIEATARREPLPFYVSAREGDSVRAAAIRRAGFSPDGWSYVHMARDLRGPIPEPALPEGFRIRPLAGEGEVEAYVATHRTAFDSTNMTADWRRSTLRDPRYAPELDLVAVNPEGTLAGFCVCWITPPLAARSGGRVAQVEPLGVLPAYRRLGLGRALLLEAFRRARAMGAVRMDVDAESYNEASRRAYGSVGFHPAFEAPFFLRRFE